MKIHQRAFTLVELSIVLVILGLLIGGVLTGQSLIRAAELRSVTTQYSRYVTAVQTFRDKYFALPGDMTNAITYWGTGGSICPGNEVNVGTGMQTCNGNGDGQLTQSGGSNEPYRFWQHLANAGLIEGSYTGTAAMNGAWVASRANSPSGRISGSLWWAYYWGAISGQAATGIFDGQYDNILEIGGATTTGGPLGNIFKPEEAYNVDMKVDDGKPATGRLVARDLAGVLATCTNTGTSSNLAATYLLTNTSLACALVFRNQF